MSNLQFDKSGIVKGNFNITRYVTFDDFDCFTQGYVEASAGDIKWPDPAEGFGPSGVICFSAFAPNTLVQIIADCKAMQKAHPSLSTAEEGAMWFLCRQLGKLAHEGFSPLVFSLEEDGKIHSAVAG